MARSSQLLSLKPFSMVHGSTCDILTKLTKPTGIFLALWVQCLGVLLERSKQRSEKIFKPLSVTAIFLFLSIVGHWLLSCARAFDAFIFAQDHATPSSPFPPAIVVYLNLAEPKSVASSALYVLTTLVGDAFMVGTSELCYAWRFVDKSTWSSSGVSSIYRMGKKLADRYSPSCNGCGARW